MLDIVEVAQNVSNYCLFGSFILTSRSNAHQNYPIQPRYRCTSGDTNLQDGGEDGAIEEEGASECLPLVDERHYNGEDGLDLTVLGSGGVLLVSELLEIVPYFVFELGLAGDSIPLPIYFDQVCQTYNMAIEFQFTIISLIIQKIDCLCCSLLK